MRSTNLVARVSSLNDVDCEKDRGRSRRKRSHSPGAANTRQHAKMDHHATTAAFRNAFQSIRMQSKSDTVENAADGAPYRDRGGEAWSHTVELVAVGHGTKKIARGGGNRRGPYWRSR